MGINVVVAKVKIKGATPGLFHDLSGRRIIVAEPPQPISIPNRSNTTTKSVPSIPIIERKFNDPPVPVLDKVLDFARANILFISDDFEDYVDIEGGIFVPELDSRDDSYFCEQCETHLKSQDDILPHIFTHLKIPRNLTKQIKKEMQWKK